MNTTKFLSLLAIVFLTAFAGCKPRDTDIQTKINDQLKESPGLDRVTATVDNGVATLSGTVSGESEKSGAAAIAKDVSGIDSVINNVITETPPAPSSNLVRDDSLMQETEAILKNFPGVTGSVSAGVITLTGSLDSGKKVTLLDSLRALNPVNINDQVTTK